MSWCKSFGSRTSKHKYPPVCLPACVPGLYSEHTISHIWGWRVESGGMGWNWGWQIWVTLWFPTLHTYIQCIEIYHIYGEMNFIVQMAETLPESLMSRRPYLTWTDGRYSPVEGQEVSLCSLAAGGLSPNMLLIQVRRALLQSTDFSLTERVRAAL